MELYTLLISKPPNLRRHCRNLRVIDQRSVLRRLCFSTISFSSTPTDSQRLSLSEDLQNKTLEILEWKRVCKQLSAFTSTSMGFSSAVNGDIPIGRTREESQRLLNQTAAAFSLREPLNFSGIEDASEIVDSSISGEVMRIRELCVLKKTLWSARKLLQQLEEVSSDDDSFERNYPLLEILRGCNFLIELEQKIEFCVDCTLSTILDGASEELEIIRSERRRNMEALDYLLRSVSRQIFQAGGINNPLVTKRRSRMCVAIRASHRSLLRDGVVLNVSSSGATYFMEPREAVDLNNNEVRLANSEKDEEQTILSLLTSEISDSAVEIKYLLDRIQELDLAVARAAYAKWFNGVSPILNPVTSENTSAVDIEGIKHPLLLESSRSFLIDDIDPNSQTSLQMGRGIGVECSRKLSDSMPCSSVPIDIKIGRGTNVVIISGPNAGGKTASMKTLGLASLMSKAGMYLPARKQPKLPWFDLVLADIGDHQSLEQSLSTFSGHMLQIRNILEVASKETLVLIDEIGSGTDPSEGVALSASILQYLKDKVSLAVVTTHYADLSRLRDTDVRFENAAMEFCLDTLQPTYRILWGCAGESNALKIARKIGFDVKIIQRAESWLEMLVPEKLDERKGLLYDSLLEERNRIGNQEREAASLHSAVMDLYHEIQDEAEDLDWREMAQMAKESQRFQEEFKAAKTQIEASVQEFENQLRVANSHQFSSLIKKAESTIASVVSNHRPNIVLIAEEMDEGSYTPKPGKQVHVKHLGDKPATVVEVSEDGRTLLVQYGKMRFRVDKSSTRAVSGRSSVASSLPGLRKQTRVTGNLRALGRKKGGEVSRGPMVQTSKNTVDLRGMRVEEASHNLNIAIASREPGSVLHVIHGMGTGVVKEQVLKILRTHPQIVRFEQESPMNYGCTVAFIK
ncbi:hypothetical protein Nepgr_028775 [Nepenthes gracilis]|uniref:Smr domain-containing protein n=1 Tax=Nepenthes gracilis TaxID=150966 RepID=A0AAD3TCP5_NEPGR|nr:hypothetical protein Nepgr_028775 [Nepenthes gracilis]